MTFFRPASAAARYAKGRPYFHPSVIERFAEFLSLKEKMRRALDIGCGTGLSTIALKKIACAIIGLDVSKAMLEHAPADSAIDYLISRAESLPFGDGMFDLITMSQVFHWLEKDRFLVEARRVLRAGGWLLVYDNYFSGQRQDNPEFQQWHRKSYLLKYPSPVRSLVSFTSEEAEREGFHLLHQERFPNTISLTVEGLIDYLVSQSNIIAAVEEQGEEIKDVRLWLREQIEPLFGNQTQVKFIFHAPLWILQRAEA